VLSDLEPLAAAIMAIPATPLVLIPGAIMGAFTGAIGYTAGTYLDALIGDENARGIIRDIKRDSDQGPEANNLPVSNGN
jgi:uncharacterized membrane protein YdjX (TVP38/TMEM64 family)